MNALLDNMRIPVAQMLPAGLIDENVEIFTTGDQVYALLEGGRVEFSQWPHWLLNALKEDLKKHPKAIQALIDLGLENDNEMLWQYARCRFGSFDGRPDYEKGKFLHTEYWDCGIRGNCPFEGKLCCSMKMKNGIISPREMQVWGHLVKGRLDKEIADKLNISDTTVPQHVRNLAKKCGVRNRGALIALGVKLNIN